MNQVKINGKLYPFQIGQTILEILHQNEIRVPSLCHDDRLEPKSFCRTCLVKEKGSSKWIPSCRTLVTGEMEIETNLPELEDYRKNIVKQLATGYPLSEVLQFPDKEFHQWLNYYGLVNDLEERAYDHIDVSHPYIQVDMARCIHCYRCVHICEEVQGQFVWHIINRGNEVQVRPDNDGEFRFSSCVSCGACADTCPTGAIEDKNVIRFGHPEKVVNSVCNYCGVGCEIAVGVKDNRIVNIKPRKGGAVNKGHLCVKGRYAWEYIYAKDRITEPMIREKGTWKVVSWEEVLNYCAEKLGKIKQQYGPDSIGILASARATNEDNYVIQKFARTVIGTNNVDNCARVCHQPTAKAMNMTLGTGAATNSFNDIELAKTIMVVGSNTTAAHAVIGARIKQQVIKGANLIVIDPRKIELANYATVHLQLKPGTNIPLLNGLAHVIITEGLFEKTFVENRIEGWEEFKEFISQWTPQRVSEICGVPSGLIIKAARIYAQQSPSICFHGLGVTEHLQGTEGVIGLVNLALLTGNIGKRGAGINPLRGQNNVQGVAMMGCDPAVYTGLALIKNYKEKFEDLWKNILPSTHGMNVLQMMDAAAKGELKAMWLVGYDLFFSLPNTNESRSAFSKIDLLIVQDLFLNESASEFADVFLPVATSFEKEGTFMNGERRVQKIRKAVDAPKEVKADWEVVCQLAAVMGKQEQFSYSSPAEIWDEVRMVWKAVYGITNERLQSRGIQWPCPGTDHPGTEVLHSESFPIGERARLSMLDFKPTPEIASSEFPLLLVTGRELYHFNAGTMTYRTPNQKIRPSDNLHVHPTDANRLQLKEGEQVKIRSKYGQAFIPVHIESSVREGEVFATFNSVKVSINHVTSNVKDNYVQTPEYKVTAVCIEKLTEQELPFGA